MRLDKFLSECTPLSRKEIKRIAKQGLITVNGHLATKGEVHVNENSDEIRVEGVLIEYKKYVYLMMNKPKGVVSATWDADKPYVTELVADDFWHFEVFPVGRLDIDTEGLLILTNDGELNHRMTSPKSKVYKKYFARLSEAAEEKDIYVFKNGIEFSDFTSKPAILEICENPKEVYISICEGKFHQVKRMCAYVGKNVEYLKRVSIGGLELDEDLQPGDYKRLSEEELKKVFNTSEE